MTTKRSPHTRDFLAAGGLLAGGLVALLIARLLLGAPALPDAGKPATSSDFATDTPNPTPKNADLHKWARPIVVEAFARIKQRQPTLPELQYAQAVCWLESSYGKGWKGAMASQKNWGAVQCPQGAAVSGVDDALSRNVGDVDLVALFERLLEDDLEADVGAVDSHIETMLEALGPWTGSVNVAGGCVAYEDGYADGTRYKVSFRSYDSDVDGAADVMRHLFDKRPRVAAALGEKGATVFRASFAMRRERYYEGFCPAATKAFGGAAVRPSLRSPDSTPATIACAQEAVKAHAQRIAQIIKELAGACGDAVALGLGTYDDADAWYRGTSSEASAAPAPKSSSASSSSPAATTKPAAPASSSPASSSSSAPASPVVPASSPDLVITSGKAGHRLLKAVREGDFEAPRWVEIPWAATGATLRVSADALRATSDGKLLRLPVTWLETLEICRRLDCVPLTAELSDLIWAQATIKLDPRPLGAWDTPEHQAASSRDMTSMDWCERFDRDLDAQISGREGLAADVGKDWILSPRLLLSPTAAVTYGWRYRNGTLIQKPGPDDVKPFHDWHHHDYSQKLRLVQRRSVEGQELLELYRARGLDPRVIALFTGAS